MKRPAYLSLTVLAVAVDLFAKARVFSMLQPGETRWIAGEWLGFVRVMNPGITGGLLSSVLDPRWITLLTGIAAVAILVYFFRAKGLRPAHLAGLALILGGAIGNLYDRVRFGEVRDFIDVWPGLAWPSKGSWLYHWPTFNPADSAIVLGVSLMVAHMLFAGRGKKAASGTAGEA